MTHESPDFNSVPPRDDSDLHENPEITPEEDKNPVHSIIEDVASEFGLEVVPVPVDGIVDSNE